MGISDRKKKETELLRQRVLDAAEDIIAQEGVRHVTMRRIASRVEYAPTVLYRLFASKNDLMDHLIARGYGGVRADYEQVLARQDQSPLQVLAGILKVYAAYALDHPNHYLMWFETSRLHVENGRLMMTHGRLKFVVFQVWLDCIEACQREGHFAGLDQQEAFQVLWARMHGLISLRLHYPDFPWLPVEKDLDEVFDLARTTLNQG